MSVKSWPTCHVTIMPSKEPCRLMNGLQNKTLTWVALFVSNICSESRELTEFNRVLTRFLKRIFSFSYKKSIFIRVSFTKSDISNRSLDGK